MGSGGRRAVEERRLEARKDGEAAWPTGPGCLCTHFMLKVFTRGIGGGGGGGGGGGPAGGNCAAGGGGPPAEEAYDGYLLALDLQLTSSGLWRGSSNGVLQRVVDHGVGWADPAAAAPAMAWFVLEATRGRSLGEKYGVAAGGAKGAGRSGWQQGSDAVVERAVLAIGLAMLEVLAHMHENNVVHGDICPRHIIETVAGSGGRAGGGHGNGGYRNSHDNNCDEESFGFVEGIDDDGDNEGEGDVDGEGEGDGGDDDDDGDGGDGNDDGGGGDDGGSDDDDDGDDVDGDDDAPGYV